jgi:hypothetical protein
LSQNKSNSFKIHLNNSQSLLFIRARPTSFFPGSAHARRAPHSPPSLSHCRPSLARQRLGAARSCSKQSAPLAGAAAEPRSAGTRSGRRLWSGPGPTPAPCHVASSPPDPPASLFSPLSHARARSKAVGRRLVPLSAPILLTRAQARRPPSYGSCLGLTTLA